MKLRVKEMSISSGGPIIAIMHHDDARKLDLHALDRVSIKNSNKIVAVLNIDERGKSVKPGQIGLMQETAEIIKAKDNHLVEVTQAQRPESISYIKKKLDGGHLSSEEIRKIVQDIVANNLSQVELTYFVAGCYGNGLDLDEAAALAKAIGESGGRLRLKNKIIVDKHCIGGVANNRTSMIVVPIVAAAGLIIPKTSSRAITSAAGTADTMEVLANVALPIKKIEQVVRKTNACLIWGGTMDLASADDALIKVEYPLSLDPHGVLLASVLSKNVAVGTTHILIDLPIGKGAKIKSRKDAIQLKNSFIRLGSMLGIRVNAIITDGSQPIGNGIGPVLEARDVISILKRESSRPLDLEKKSVMMADLILKMAKSNHNAQEILDSGLAYKKMLEIINAQGAHINLDLAKDKHDILSKKSGRVTEINNKMLARIARIAGAPKEKEAGVYLYVHKNDKVKKGDKLFTIYASNKKNLHDALQEIPNIAPVVIK